MPRLAAKCYRSRACCGVGWYRERIQGLELRATGQDASLCVAHLEERFARRLVAIVAVCVAGTAAVFGTRVDTRPGQDREVVLIEQNDELRELNKARVVPFSNLARRLTVTPAEGDSPHQDNAREH